MSQIKKTAAPAKFALGDPVRVLAGVMDPDFPDIPLGGWTGKIAEVEDGTSPLYLIRWSKDTINNMHPVYRKRCERDGLDFEEMRLFEEDLESDLGGPVILEPPAKIITPPLSVKDQDDRIRTVFAQTKDDILPEVDDASLRTYYKFLEVKLSFPFEATLARETARGNVTEKVTVLALGGFEDDPWIDDLYGILCKVQMNRGSGEIPLAEIEEVIGKPNKQLAEDYAYWFWNNR